MNLLQSPHALPPINCPTIMGCTHGSHFYTLFQIKQIYYYCPTAHRMDRDNGIKYGLKNASAYLQKLRSERCEQAEWQNSMNEKQQTFDNCEMPSSKESPQKIPSFIKIKKNSKNENKKLVKSTICSTENLEEPIEVKPEETEVVIGLADLVIKEHLEAKLKVYEQDLLQLQENRDNLVHAIQEIASKIQALHDLQDKNQLLELENFKNKKQILSLIKHYHELKLNLQIKKVRAQENFHRKKEKIKSLLEVMPEENEYVVEAESLNFYYYELRLNKKSKSEDQNQEKALAEIFPKVEEVSEQKKKQKPKTSVDKSGLLGDLKNFAKNFKMPSNPPSQA